VADVRRSPPEESVLETKKKVVATAAQLDAVSREELYLGVVRRRRAWRERPSYGFDGYTPFTTHLDLGYLDMVGAVEPIRRCSAKNGLEG
jgi:hypothetical protein